MTDFQEMTIGRIGYASSCLMVLVFLAAAIFATVTWAQHPRTSLLTVIVCALGALGYIVLPLLAGLVTGSLYEHMPIWAALLVNRLIYFIVYALEAVLVGIMI